MSDKEGAKMMMECKVRNTIPDGRMDYFLKMARRKDIDPGQYLVDNFEWDDQPECINVGRIWPAMCARCEWNDRCPDMKGKVS